MFLFWDELSLREAKQLTAQWEQERPAALAWLEEQMGDPIPRDAEGLNRAWVWYLAWKGKPRGVSGRPSPIWWVEEGGGTTHFSREQAIGLDALGHLLEEVLRREFPQLVRFHVTRGRSKYPVIGENAPQLAILDGASPAAQIDTSFFMIRVGNYANVGHPATGESAGPDLLYEYYNDFSDRLRDALQKVAPQQQPPLRDRLTSGDLIEVARDEDEEYPVQIYLDEELAHEHEDLVASFVEALTDAPGVTEAFHQDREVIALSGKIDVGALDDWATGWWSRHLSPS